MCSWIGLIDATPDTIFNGLSSFFRGMQGTTISKGKFGKQDALILDFTYDTGEQISYIIRTGDIFTVMFFSGKSATLAANNSTILAIVNSIRYKNQVAN